MNVAVGIGFFELLILSGLLVFGTLAVSSSRRSAVFLVVLGGSGLVLLLAAAAALLYVRTMSQVPTALGMPAEAQWVDKPGVPPAAVESARSHAPAARPAPPPGSRSASPSISDAKAAAPPEAGPVKSDENRRPEWVDQPDGFRDGAFHQVVHAGPFATTPECQAELTRLMRTALRDYLSARPALGDSPAREAAQTLDDALLRRAVLRETWTETTEHSFGPMLTVHARLEFGPEILRELADRALALRRERRLGITGLAAAGVVGALTAAFALLKMLARA